MFPKCPQCGRKAVEQINQRSSCPLTPLDFTITYTTIFKCTACSRKKVSTGNNPEGTNKAAYQLFYEENQEQTKEVHHDD